MTLQQWQADVDEELAISDFLKAKRVSDMEPFFTVNRPSPRGGVEQRGGRSLLRSAIADGLVLAWFAFGELLAHLRPQSPGRGK